MPDLCERIVTAVLCSPHVPDDVGVELDNMRVDEYVAMKQDMRARVERILNDAEREAGNGC